MELLVSTETKDRTRQGAVPAFRLVDSQLGQVRKLIHAQLTAPAKTAELDAALAGGLEHIDNHSGKMLRPGLVLLAGASCGRITGEHIRTAAVIEMIHNATLLHDDVIDEGQTRRGAPTINNLWGNESAVLLGDFLLGRVFKMCVDLEPWVGRMIASASVRVCEGELRQVAQRRNWQLSEPEYIDIITEKSASIFSCCCYLGGLLARAGKTEAQALADFGLNAGIAFQIADDLLDITGDEDKAGKTLGSDADKSKLTLAVIHFLKTAGEKDKDEIKDRLIAAPGGNKVVTELLNRYGSIEYARKRAKEFTARAVKALDGLEKSDAKDALVETAIFMADRTS